MRPFFLLLFLAFLASCSQTQKITDGPIAFEQKQYHLAADLLKKDYQKAKSRVEQGKIAFLIGESYRRMNLATESADWFQRAYTNQYGVEALKQYAYALKASQRYPEAIAAFKELGLEIGSPYEYRKEITACEVAQGWLKPAAQEYRAQPADFNSAAGEYSPALFEGKILLTSDRAAATGEDTYYWTGNRFSDLFLVDPKTGIFQAFDKTVNSPSNEGTAVLSPDGAELFFTRCTDPEKGADQYCRIYRSQKGPAGWEEPEELPFQEIRVNYMHPALSADGKILYFASNHPDGWGGYDIYASVRQGGDFGLPSLLSRTVNTPGNELFPSFDGDTLYFASDNHTGMGGLDIFKTYPAGNQSWNPVYNLKAPINSGADDFGFLVAPSEGEVQTGFFTSNRQGSDDIFSYEKRRPEIPPTPVETPAQTVEYKILLDVFVVEKIFQNPDDPNSAVLGRRPLPGAKVQLQKGRITQDLTVDANGYIQIQAEEDADYRFLASQSGYLTNEAKFSTAGIGKNPAQPVQVFEVEILLEKIFANREITLKDIYYDFDRWEIRDDAKPTLDKLANDLELNPGIRIQMASHTDCRGSDSYNEELSQKRAQSAVDYLISKGIDPDRLAAVGFGESQPAVTCICSRCTEEEHQSNRRTTFAIVDQ